MLIRGNMAIRAAYIGTVRLGQCQTAPLPIPVSTITFDTRHDTYYAFRLQQWELPTCDCKIWAHKSVNCPVEELVVTRL